jgi:hypothetical protein
VASWWLVLEAAGVTVNGRTVKDSMAYLRANTSTIRVATEVEMALSGDAVNFANGRWLCWVFKTAKARRSVNTAKVPSLLARGQLADMSAANPAHAIGRQLSGYYRRSAAQVQERMAGLLKETPVGHVALRREMTILAAMAKENGAIWSAGRSRAIISRPLTKAGADVVFAAAISSVPTAKPASPRRTVKVNIASLFHLG